ncbi:MAG: hypothetical protein ACRDSR_09380 [Pseudonocardiaceae bacterium]
MAVLVGLMTAALVLLTLGRGIEQYMQNVTVNLGADLIGAIVTIFVIAPIVSRAGEGRVREHPRLDYAWYVDRVAGATSTIRIMDTFSNLLDGPHTERFFQAVQLALEREAVVLILLLDPDSLAARQRAHELDNPDVYREIMHNLRILYDFHNTVLPVSMRRNFSVRMYTASPSITVYRWDEKALVGFFPVGKISSQGVHLEVIASSPLGEFVNERFNSLWNASKDIGQFMRLPVTFIDGTVADLRLEVKFVDLNGRLYVSDPRMVAQMARRRTAAALVYSHYHDQQVLNELTLVDDTQPELLATLCDQFLAKYDHNDDVFVSLEPVIEDNLSVLATKSGKDSERP